MNTLLLALLLIPETSLPKHNLPFCWAFIDPTNAKNNRTKNFFIHDYLHTNIQPFTSKNSGGPSPPCTQQYHILKVSVLNVTPTAILKNNIYNLTKIMCFKQWSSLCHIIIINLKYVQITIFQTYRNMALASCR